MVWRMVLAKQWKNIDRMRAEAGDGERSIIDHALRLREALTPTVKMLKRVDAVQFFTDSGRGNVMYDWESAIGATLYISDDYAEIGDDGEGLRYPGIGLVLYRFKNKLGIARNAAKIKEKRKEARKAARKRKQTP